MIKMKLAVLLATALLASCVDAQNTVEANIKKALEPHLGGAKIESVKETPYGGLYEVRVAGDILYTDKKGEFLVIGQVYDVKSSRNLTRERIDDINKIKFSDLPLEMALKQVKGNGKRVIAVFEDPNCGYCKRLRQTTLNEIDNVTIYTFMYNILSQDSFTKSKNIWCAPNRNKAWDDWMINGKVPPAAPNACESPNDKVLALGQKLRITGTPAIFFSDGTRIPGAIDLKALEAKFDSLEAKPAK
ncbi:MULTISPECIES: DsbC family protein [Massilia]|uniref:Thiol:disulfide interchange protein n=1 Tax=Massilia arenae TaxID=2603288 RepID=A0A5C7FQA0_9BURK|nr:MULTISPECIES: DsbC family protein [Massilia]MDY0964531.1 DsbC family protein [Massilia sp. CFBP9026]TXF96434.1 DsbC family protein [Massilia arenae]